MGMLSSHFDPSSPVLDVTHAHSVDIHSFIPQILEASLTHGIVRILTSDIELPPTLGSTSNALRWRAVQGRRGQANVVLWIRKLLIRREGVCCWSGSESARLHLYMEMLVGITDEGDVKGLNERNSGSIHFHVRQNLKQERQVRSYWNSEDPAK